VSLYFFKEHLCSLIVCLPLFTCGETAVALRLMLRTGLEDGKNQFLQ